jgi:hypothetical protein
VAYDQLGWNFGAELISIGWYFLGRCLPSVKLLVDRDINLGCSSLYFLNCLNINCWRIINKYMSKNNEKKSIDINFEN